jgi:methyl-accepting chemotaxis protein
MDVLIPKWEAFKNANQLGAQEVLTDVIPAFKAFGISADDMPAHFDTLTTLFSTTDVTAEEFAGAMKRMGPTLQDTGLSIDDTSALLLSLSQHGEDGRTGISNLTTAMKDAEKQNLTGAAAIAFITDKLKLNSTEVDANRLFLTSNTGATQDFNKAEQDTHTGMDTVNADVTKSTVGFGGLASVLSPLSGVLSMVGSGFVSLYAIGALFPSLGATISSAAAGLGSTMTAAGTALAGSMVAGIGAGLLLGLGGVWILLQTGVLDAFNNLGRWIETSPIGATIMDALRIVLAPIGSLGAGIIALVQGNFAGIGPAMMGPLNQASSAISGFVNSVNGMLSNFGSGFSGLVGTVQGVFSGIGSAFGGMTGQIQGVFSQLMRAILTVINSTASGFYAAGMNIITSMVNGIVAAAGGIVTAIGNALNAVRSLFPFSPAKEGPLAQVPNWSSYMSEPIAKEAPAAARAASQVAGAVAGAGPAAAAAGGAGKGTGSGGGDTITIAPGAIVINGAGQNADQIANMVIQKFTQARMSKGYRTSS